MSTARTPSASAAPGATSAVTLQSPPSSSSSGQQRSEDSLGRMWRSVAQDLVKITARAEMGPEHARDLDNDTKEFLKDKYTWDRSLSYLETKLQGKAAETEALQQYVRCHPSLKRKRKCVENKAEKIPSPTAQQEAT